VDTDDASSWWVTKTINGTKSYNSKGKNHNRDVFDGGPKKPKIEYFDQAKKIENFDPKITENQKSKFFQNKKFD
jgi:hypothetical protein